MKYNKSQKIIQNIVASFGAITTGFIIGLFVFSLIPVPQVMPSVINVANASTLSVSCSVTSVSATTAEWVANVSGGSGSVTYSWSGTDGLSDSTATTTKTYTTSGTKTGTVSVSSGSSSSSAMCSIVMTITSSSPVCSDGIDNDGDGSTDYPADIGCSSASDTDESNIPLGGTCSVSPTTATTGSSVTWTAVPTGGVSPYAFTWSGTDGLSGSATTTSKSYSSAGTKTGSVTVVSGTESLALSCTNSVVVSGPVISPQCSDGIDNDGDGLIDTLDPACHSDGDATNAATYTPAKDDENSIPVITLTGSNLSLIVGSAFTDPSATADDEEDGNITSSLVVAGDTVDTATVGTYTITYNVVDSKGAAAVEVTRVVTVTDPTPTPTPTPSPSPAPLSSGGGGGGTPIRLEISNEKVERLATSTALVTWDTNLQAQSKVFYGKDSHASSSLPFVEYTNSTEKATSFVKKHSMIITGLEHNVPYYFRPAAIRSNAEKGGIELVLTLDGPQEPAEPAVCSEYLLEPIKYGADNNPDEVIKLQKFLNSFEGFNLDITGVYNLETFAAVEAFQEKYAGDILTPWGIEGSTGYVYITTMKKINEIYCNKFIDFDILDVEEESDREEIREFNALIESLRESGLPLPDTSKVGLRGPAPTSDTSVEADTGLAVDTGDIDEEPSLSDVVLTEADDTDDEEEIIGNYSELASVISTTDTDEDRNEAIKGFFRNINVVNFVKVLFHAVF